MRSITRNILILFLLLSVFSVNAEAKWWIFGVAKEEVTMSYLYLNRVSYEEMGQRVTLYRETLPDGMILINGKASIRKGKIASVRVSVNNKESWEDARLSEDGAFEYRFRPELNKTYIIYVEVMDTRGKTNDIEATRKEVAVSEKRIMASVKEVLDQMIDAYRREDSAQFMSFVSEDFAGDKTNLDRAIRKDFSLFDNIDLRFTINNVATGAKGMIFVSLNYSRMLVSSRTGQSFTDKGITEFVFKLRDIGPQVFSMKNPLIFGLSDAANVATGVVQSPTNEPTVIIDDKGNVDKKPFDQAMRIITGEGAVTVESGRVTLQNFDTVPPNISFEIFTFATESKETETNAMSITGDITNVRAFPVSLILFKRGTKWKDLGTDSIDSVTEVPDAATYSSAHHTNLTSDKLYALYLTNGKYALVKIKNHNYNLIPGTPEVGNRFVTIDYKYQPDGSRRFK